MKKIVKPLFFGVFLCATVFQVSAQNASSSAAGFVHDMKDVIRDYRHQFSHLQGGIISENPQSTDFESTIRPAGTESATITKYASRNKSVYSWQSTVLVTEDFEVAKKRFKSLYAMFNNMAIKMDYGITLYLKGRFQEPVEEKRFASAMLHFDQADQLTEKMKLEISLQYEDMEWRVRVLIYEKEREDDERGEIVE